MYGDDYQPSDRDRYDGLERLFNACQSKEELSTALMLALLDMKIPREELHVLHKRTCLKKGWEEV